ncbi:hypothetical protein FRACA_2800008 [Frankia canadensis]|uniref:Uncharacterized protein n=1 Tax=Frankia canadensis TaxID=1836972 RepID=A0A2I2KT37_9ACTN|nr:hypothetical protein [Frankia canadensis]SNQ48827.1 hypothetical protein FRACA_2800008 [Frankia canadensis]SOU56117.1 hypothetical protein FRACA_2800008 [Frankia canadensis]
MLTEHSYGFNELDRAIEGISRRVLTQTLRGLVAEISFAVAISNRAHLKSFNDGPQVPVETSLSPQPPETVRHVRNMRRFTDDMIAVTCRSREVHNI